MADKIFPDGLIYKAPRDGAPDFIKGTLSIKVQDFIKFLEAHEANNGWVNIDLKESREGKFYSELNTFKPEKPESLREAPDTNDPALFPADGNDSIPF